MDVTRLPFDVDSMLAGLRPWVECESPTFDVGAVNRMMGLAGRRLAGLGASVETIAGHMGFSDSVRARFPHPKAGEPGILILGHLDSVHPIGTLEALPWRRENDTCYGPAILDMKSGNYLAMEAIAQLTAAGFVTPLPVTYLLTGDEEVGTPANRTLIEQEAARAKYVLVPEPGPGNGDVVTGRYAIARFNLAAKGKPSHAGAHLKAGRSAVREMATRLLEIEAMTTDDCTYSVSVVRGGDWVNCVPSLCTAQALSMAKRQADLDAGVDKILKLSHSNPDMTFEVTRGVTRPVWEPSGQTMELYEMARRIGKTIGFELAHQSVGGGSDGNFTGAMGIPTLDGLGGLGAGAHTLGEHIRIESLITRGKLFAGLLAELA
ncbi:glutamate carboxypeptidase [Rhodoligotrophos appendicifer]|uniref:M20/M25/M40 family metallo-hydrolase n=1 Tax=Rhodoligotrophos appendicifer TaxID=987056 RepID=UPI0011864720|nr:M20/M25/M40 family metallo-hydrolase [Rhodoligotrophos appendicifer]